MNMKPTNSEIYVFHHIWIYAKNRIFHQRLSEVSQIFFEVADE